MKRKLVIGLMTVIIGSSLVACGNDNNNGVQAGAEVTQNAFSGNGQSNQQNNQTISNNTSKNSNDKQKNNINEYGGDISKLEDEYKTDIDTIEKAYEALVNSIDSYDKFVSNNDKIEEFYEVIATANKELCLKMCYVASNYAKEVVNSSKSAKDKYNALKDIDSDIYSGLFKDLNMDIYDGVMKDLNKAFYEGLLKDAYNTAGKADYSSWYDTRSEEYNRWYDTRSDVYNDWYDIRSDLYNMYYDARSYIYDDDIERANKTIDKFNERLAKYK